MTQLNAEQLMESKATQITLDEAVELFKGGDKLIVCEYRLGKAERINYRDKVTQKAAQFVTVRHSIEIGDSAFVVSERVPDDFDEKAFKPTITKGTKCVLRFERFAVANGVGQFSGTLIPLVNRPGRPA